ncbi:MAG: helix-turn-helix domain-containing protein [Leptospirales bacterium]
MTQKTLKNKKSRIIEEMHETASILYNSGLIDLRRMLEFEELRNLEVEKITPEKIKSLREKENVSQAVFAEILNISVSTVQKWETGEKQPSGSSLKLLDLIKRKGLEVVL